MWFNKKKLSRNIFDLGAIFQVEFILKKSVFPVFLSTSHLRYQLKILKHRHLKEKNIGLVPKLRALYINKHEHHDPSIC